MMGLEGTILSRRGDCRLLVAVNFLQQGASVAIDDCMLEPVDGDSFSKRHKKVANSARSDAPCRWHWACRVFTPSAGRV